MMSDAEDESIHWVAEMVGSERFGIMVERGRVPSRPPNASNWPPEYGDDRAAWPICREKFNVFEQLIRRFGGTLRFISNMLFMQGVNGLILMGALGDQRHHLAMQQRMRQAS